MSDYAWIIDVDHLNGPGGEFYNPDKPESIAGISGPSDARASAEALRSPETAKAALARNYVSSNEFHMYDDDGILYVTGTLFWDGGAPDEHQVYGPLGDYGMPALGCVTVRYTGHPEYDCG
jgi:hypothetical protein